MDVHLRARFALMVSIACVAACGGTPHAPVTPDPRGEPGTGSAVAPRAPDPDLLTSPPRPLLAIDWAKVPLATDADALAVWASIAPTGEDWDAKLEEIPVAQGRALAIALLHGGNFACVPPRPVAACVPPVLDVEPPAPTATIADPCLRRLLALWSLAQLDDADVPGVMDALRAIAALPPPESELVAAAIETVPEDDQPARLELLALAHRAGQHELANGMAGKLDEAHVIAAVTRHHIEGGLDALAAESHRAVFLSAIADEALAATARAQAMTELVSSEDPLSAEVRAAVRAATRANDCLIAATAARALEARGDLRFVPRRPRTRSSAAMMRALCVLASYERLQDRDEASVLASFVLPKGLELVQTELDALAELAGDGDGDPRTDRVTLVAPGDVALPELDDLVRAFRNCAGTTCSTVDREFRFDFKPRGGQLYLARLEVAERPACPAR